MPQKAADFVTAMDALDWARSLYSKELSVETESIFDKLTSAETQAKVHDASESAAPSVIRGIVQNEIRRSHSSAQQKFRAAVDRLERAVKAIEQLGLQLDNVPNFLEACA